MEKFLTRALTNDLKNKIKIDNTYQQVFKTLDKKDGYHVALWSKSWALPLSVLDQLNANPGFQVIAFNEVECKPNFVAWLCRLGCPV